jgi:hypothetical protein
MNECIEKSSARNGNLEVPVYLLKAKQGHAIRKMGKHIHLISAGMKFGKKSSSMLYQNIRAHFEA